MTTVRIIAGLAGLIVLIAIMLVLLLSLKPDTYKQQFHSLKYPSMAFVIEIPKGKIITKIIDDQEEEWVRY